MKKLFMLFITGILLAACNNAPDNISVMKWVKKDTYTVEDKLETKDKNRINEYVKLVKEIKSEKEVPKKLGHADFIITHLTKNNSVGKNRLVVWTEGKNLYVGEDEQKQKIYPIDTAQEEKIRSYIKE